MEESTEFIVLPIRNALKSEKFKIFYNSLLIKETSTIDETELFDWAVIEQICTLTDNPPIVK